MGRKTNVSKHLSEQEIKKIYKSCSSHKDKLKLLAVMNLYNGKTISDTAGYLMISYSNLKKFIKRWNEEGIYSLEKINGNPKVNQQNTESV